LSSTKTHTTRVEALARSLVATVIGQSEQTTLSVFRQIMTEPNPESVFSESLNQVKDWDRYLLCAGLFECAGTLFRILNSEGSNHSGARLNIFTIVVHGATPLDDLLARQTLEEEILRRVAGCKVAHPESRLVLCSTNLTPGAAMAADPACVRRIADALLADLIDGTGMAATHVQKLIDNADDDDFQGPHHARLFIGGRLLLSPDFVFDRFDLLDPPQFKGVRAELHTSISAEHNEMLKTAQLRFLEGMLGVLPTKAQFSGPYDWPTGIGVAGEEVLMGNLAAEATRCGQPDFRGDEAHIVTSGDICFAALTRKQYVIGPVGVPMALAAYRLDSIKERLLNRAKKLTIHRDLRSLTGRLSTQ
jgi:hypothetical protein